LSERAHGEGGQDGGDDQRLGHGGIPNEMEVVLPDSLKLARLSPGFCPQREIVTVG
jgi:hypothetical protein